MQEITGNLWNPSSYSNATPHPDAICITTNGFVKSNGCAVMGRGCAKQATQKCPNIESILGKLIRENGNTVQLLPRVKLSTGEASIISFPVKPKQGINNGCNVVDHMKSRFTLHQVVPGWAMKADICLIEQSAKELVELCNAYNYQIVILPRPGCGAGELKWEHICKLLMPILDNRFYVITY